MRFENLADVLQIWQGMGGCLREGAEGKVQKLFEDSLPQFSLLRRRETKIWRKAVGSLVKRDTHLLLEEEGVDDISKAKEICMIAPIGDDLIEIREGEQRSLEDGVGRVHLAIDGVPEAHQLNPSLVPEGGFIVIVGAPRDSVDAGGASEQEGIWSEITVNDADGMQSLDRFDHLDGIKHHQILFDRLPCFLVDFHHLIH